jgi:hypothetical protein
VFVALDPPTADTLALDLDGRRATQGELAASTAPSDERLLVEPGPLTRDVDLLVAAGLGSGSLVVVVQASDEVRGRIAEQERARIA